MNSAAKKLIVFDFGETLAYYGGTKLNWSEHYGPALTYAAQSFGMQFSQKGLQQAKQRLEHFDTRTNPRTEEYPSCKIFDTIAANLGPDTDRAAFTKAFTEAFFQYFSRNIIVYAETLETLRNLKASGYHTAILTDVPYGMDTYLVANDLSTSGITEHIDVLFSSVDVGYRKPDKRGLNAALAHFSISPEQAVYVGNEPKDRDCAINAGVDPILIDRSTNHPVRHHGDHTIINCLSELPTLLGEK